MIPGLAIEKTWDVYLRMASSYDKTDEDHGIKKGLWEDSGFDCWFDGEDDDSVNDVLLESTSGSRWSCRFTLILKDPDHESLAFMIALGDPVLLMGDEEVPCFVNGHDQVVVELDPTNDFQLFIWALESLRDEMETDLRVGCLVLRGMSGGLIDDRIDATNVSEVDDDLDPVRSTVFEVRGVHLIELDGNGSDFRVCW